MAAALAAPRAWLPTYNVGGLRGSFATTTMTTSVVAVGASWRRRRTSGGIPRRNVTVQASVVTTPTRALTIPQVFGASTHSSSALFTSEVGCL